MISCMLCNLNIEICSQYCMHRTGHYDALLTIMAHLSFLLPDLFPLDDFRCGIVSAP